MLSDQQKQLLFDYCFQTTTEQETAQAQELVFSNDEATRFVASVKASLSPLDSIADEICPDELAEGTIWRAQQAVRTAQVRLNQLLAEEQNRKVSARQGIWRTIFGQFATAALFIIVGGGLLTGGKVATNYAHQKYSQTQCGSQLAGLYQGLSNYKDDNNDHMPTLMPILASTTGTPWFKVGEQGSENVSRMYVLVKYGYVDKNDFMCPGRRSPKGKDYDPKNCNDFPDRSLVTYSIRISCPESASAESGRWVIIADRSPVFEGIFLPSSKCALPITVSDALLKLNSVNHKGRGQNTLFSDGSVTFVRVRFTDASLDDIYTLQNTKTYNGTELPATEADTFLAP
jgi:hypothetical protein